MPFCRISKGTEFLTYVEWIYCWENVGIAGRKSGALFQKLLFSRYRSNGRITAGICYPGPKLWESGMSAKCFFKKGTKAKVAIISKWKRNRSVPFFGSCKTAGWVLSVLLRLSTKLRCFRWIAFMWASGYTCFTIIRKETSGMAETRNLCAKCWAQHLAHYGE